MRREETFPSPPSTERFSPNKTKRPPPPPPPPPPPQHPPPPPPPSIKTHAKRPFSLWSLRLESPFPKTIGEERNAFLLSLFSSCPCASPIGTQFSPNRRCLGPKENPPFLPPPPQRASLSFRGETPSLLCVPSLFFPVGKKKKKSIFSPPPS